MGSETRTVDMASETGRPPTVAGSRGMRGIQGGGSASDVELLRHAGSDADAFGDFYERYSEEICGYFRRRTADRDTALELTAETFSRAWVARERIEDRHQGSAAPWLFGIARNVLLMSIRRGVLERRTAARLGVLERLDLGAAAAAPEPGWADGADELLDSLPLSQREALRLRIVDERSYEEVADALGTSRPAARARVHRALTVLRGRFQKDETDEFHDKEDER
jgi:DNA-directed RNA polymerase specialized sigma24 family protein